MFFPKCAPNGILSVEGILAYMAQNCLVSCEDKEIILLTFKLLIDLFKERKQRIT
jgi:hypothetical protein